MTSRQIDPEVRKLADKSFAILKTDPHHSSLRLKKTGRFSSASMNGSFGDAQMLHCSIMHRTLEASPFRYLPLNITLTIGSGERCNSSTSPGPTEKACMCLPAHSETPASEPRA
jgi:hypothetical protein